MPLDHMGPRVLLAAGFIKFVAARICDSTGCGKLGFARRWQASGLLEAWYGLVAAFDVTASQLSTSTHYLRQEIRRPA